MELKLYHGENALPYTVWVEFDAADPSVGYNEPCISEVVILSIAGSSDKTEIADFQESLTDEDWQYINKKAYEELEKPIYF